jgi:hypothetical protein
MRTLALIVVCVLLAGCQTQYSVAKRQYLSAKAAWLGATPGPDSIVLFYRAEDAERKMLSLGK